MPDEERKAKAIKANAQDYVDAGVTWRFPEREINEARAGNTASLRSLIEGAIDELNPDSHPGVPFCYQGAGWKNKHLIAHRRPLLVNSALERILIIAEFECEMASQEGEPWSEMRADRGRWILTNTHDPVRMFAKNQPTPYPRKPLGRLIQGESVCDQIVNRVLFSKFQASCGDKFPFPPNLKGTGFDQKGADILFLMFEAINRTQVEKPVSSDVSGWEKNFSACTCDCMIAVFMACCVNPSPTLLHFLLWWKWSLLTIPYVDGDGNIIIVEKELGMNSGTLLTNDANGAGRGGVGRYAGSAVIKTNGDDSIEWPSPGTTIEMLKSEYAKMGVKLRDVTQLSDQLIFSSHVFARVDGRVACWLITWDRMFHELISTKKDDENFEAAVRCAFDEIIDDPVGIHRNKLIVWVDAQRSARKRRGALGLAPND
jgi:hypothetical protein